MKSTSNQTKCCDRCLEIHQGYEKCNDVSCKCHQTKCCEKCSCTGDCGLLANRPLCHNYECICHRKQQKRNTLTDISLEDATKLVAEGKAVFFESSTQQEGWEERPYHEIDHSHCWSSKKPPCGQRIEHLKCCLCEIRNPKVRSLLTEQKKAFVEMVEEMKNNSYQDYCGDECVEKALTDLLTKLKDI